MSCGSETKTVTDAISIAEVFQKMTQQTPKQVIETCKRRLRQYDRIVGGEHG